MKINVHFHQTDEHRKHIQSIQCHYSFIKCVDLPLILLLKVFLKNWGEEKKTCCLEVLLKTVSGNEEILLKIVVSI